MSGYIVEKFWHLGNYHYVFYRFVLEQYCHQRRKKKRCLMLDAGCGPRICSLSHVPENFFVVGIDVNRWNVAESHRKAKDRIYENFSFVVASITSLPFRHEAFEVAVCVDVLEHLPTKRKAIEEISRTCRPKGEFVGSTTNLMNPLMLLDSFAPKSLAKILTKRFAGEHYERHFRFSFSKLMQTLNRANFQACNVNLIGFPPFQPSVYEFSNKKLPWYAYVWIVFNRLTEKKPLNFLKETMLFHAVKNGQNILLPSVCKAKT
jgi:2-polyprenyl-3-methyl-5-hydroxy-6-metoxy-1,4-benzoquinol methylase